MKKLYSVKDMRRLLKLDPFRNAVKRYGRTRSPTKTYLPGFGLKKTRNVPRGGAPGFGKHP